MLQDMAVLTGGRVISDDIGMKLESIELDMLGRADKVKTDKDDTTLIGGKGERKEIQGRIAQIKTIQRERELAAAYGVALPSTLGFLSANSKSRTGSGLDL